MAKAFYTQDEAKEALNTDDDGLKSFVHDNRLTEYRDGENLMYKGSQVEALSAELEGGDDIGLSDTGGPIGLADSGMNSASGSAIALDGGDSIVAEDNDLSVDDLEDDRPAARSGTGSAVRPAPTPPPADDDEDVATEDTGSFALTDTGIGTGMGTGMGTGVGSGVSAQGSRSGTGSSPAASGITIFEDDESDDADPAAQTNIGKSGSSDQVNLEGIGSGSGLLDLTQEADDTSFGAETFDQIMPEGSLAGGSMAAGTVAGYVDDDEDVGGIDTAAAPAGTRPVGVVYEPDDPLAPIFGGLAGGAAFVALLGLLAVALAALGAAPGFLATFMSGPGEGVATGPLLGLALGLPILGAIIGFVGAKMGNNA